MTDYNWNNQEDTNGERPVQSGAVNPPQTPPVYGQGQEWNYGPQAGGYAPNYPNYPAHNVQGAQGGHAGKKGVSGKGVVAIILCCALVFGTLGYSFSSVYRDVMAKLSERQRVEETQQADEGETGSAGRSEYADRDLSLLTPKAEAGALTTPEIVAKTQNSVVEIVTESVQTGNMFQQYIASGAGSGVIITEDGFILTNNHVIEDAAQITVTLRNGESYTAKLVGLDEQLDVALLKIEATGLTAAEIGTSDSLVVGQTVIAIGNPLGQLGGTVTQGIISALDRKITVDGQSMNLMQIDAAVNPGNSGGGLFNAQGSLVGIVTAKSSGSDVDGLGFAIPLDHAMEILDDLKDYGYVKGRVSIGITLVDITTDQMAWMYRVSEKGVYIYSVVAGSSAERDGLKSGDLVVSVNGTKVADSTELKNEISKVSVGDEVSFVVKRGGIERTVVVTAGEYIPAGISGNTGAEEQGSTGI